MAEEKELGLTAAEVRDLYCVFQLVDRESDGRAPWMDLLNFVRSMGQQLTEAEFTDVYAETDLDGDGLLDFAEFCHLVRNKMSAGCPDLEMQDIFAALDRRGRGSISLDDLLAATADLPTPLLEEEAEAVFRAAGVDLLSSLTLADITRLATLRQPDDAALDALADLLFSPHHNTPNTGQ